MEIYSLKTFKVDDKVWGCSGIDKLASANKSSKCRLSLLIKKKKKMWLGVELSIMDICNGAAAEQASWGVGALQSSSHYVRPWELTTWSW